MVCRNLARAVNSRAEPLGGGAEMRRRGSFDRLEPSLAAWPTEPDRQQQPLPHPARLEPAEYLLALLETLDGTGTNPRISTHQGRLQRASRRPQAGLRAPLMPRCAHTTNPRRSRSFATDRRLQVHAQCRTDTPTLAVLQEDSLSAPHPGGRPPCAACAGTKPSSIGPLPWDSKPANVLTADGRTDAMSFPANM